MVYRYSRGIYNVIQINLVLKMIKVLVPACPNNPDNYDLCCEHNLKIVPNRPHYRGESEVCYLTGRLNTWLKEHNIIYSLYKEQDVKYPTFELWYIVFENKSDAMFFKLIWGGE